MSPRPLSTCTLPTSARHYVLPPPSSVPQLQRRATGLWGFFLLSHQDCPQPLPRWDFYWKKYPEFPQHDHTSHGDKWIKLWLHGVFKEETCAPELRYCRAGMSGQDHVHQCGSVHKGEGVPRRKPDSTYAASSQHSRTWWYVCKSMLLMAAAEREGYHNSRRQSDAADRIRILIMIDPVSFCCCVSKMVALCQDFATNQLLDLFIVMLCESTYNQNPLRMEIIWFPALNCLFWFYSGFSCTLSTQFVFRLLCTIHWSLIILF